MKINVFILLSMSFLLAACGGDSSSDSPDSTGTSYNTMQIDAEDSDNWIYVDLATGEEVSLTAEEAASSVDWDIAFRRYNVILNGGASGSGNVAGAMADEQAEFYTDGEPDASVFTNADADIEAAALAVDYDLSTLSFEADANVAVIQDWYIYDMTAHTISANTDVGWMVRHADGATYSKFTLTTADYDGVAVSYETQAADTTQFAGGTQTISATFADDSTEICLDFDTAAAVDCATDAANWELRYEVDLTSRALGIWSNGGVYGDGNGAVFGEIDATTLAGYTSATTVESTDVSSLYAQDSASGIFASYSWWEYNLAGSHLLWPNYRTYIIDTDTSDEASEKYTLQISDYYSLGGAATPEIHYQLIDEAE